MAAPASRARRDDMLVLCRANQIRSPLAAGLLRRRLAMLGRLDLKVVSAGLEVVTDFAVRSEVVQMALERGIDLTNHRPRPITVESIAGAALVVTMTEDQRSTAVRLHRAAIPYTFTLAELVRLLGVREGPPLDAWGEMARRAHAERPYVAPPSHAEDVADPIGRTIQQHRLTADTLVHLTEQLVDHVTRGASLRSR